MTSFAVMTSFADAAAVMTSFAAAAAAAVMTSLFRRIFSKSFAEWLTGLSPFGCGSSELSLRRTDFDPHSDAHIT